MFGWLRRVFAREVDRAAWHRPYEVGPCAPVSATNPHPPVPPVQMPAVGPDGRWGTRDQDYPYIYGTAAYKRAEARKVCDAHCLGGCTWPRCLQ